MTGRDASRRDASRRGAILTVTPNTALDTVLFVEGFAFGETVRAQGVATGMGGKGAVTSWVLGQLGTGVARVAAGETGGMEAMLRAAGVETDFRWVGARRAELCRGARGGRLPGDGDRLRAGADAGGPGAAAAAWRPCSQARFSCVAGATGGDARGWYAPSSLAPVTWGSPRCSTWR